MQLHLNAAHIADVASDEGEFVENRGGSEQSVYNWARALAAPLASQARGGGVYAEHAIGESEFEALNPRSESLGGRRIAALFCGHALAQLAQGQDADVKR